MLALTYGFMRQPSCLCDINKVEVGKFLYPLINKLSATNYQSTNSDGLNPFIFKIVNLQ